MAALTADTLEGGFHDPVFQSQAVFRAVMAALAEPARPVPLPPSARPPAPLTAELGAVALTLADPDTPVWLDPALAASDAVRAWLAFHTGAPVTAEPMDAAFALVADPARLPPLSAFAQGTAEYPDRSTTLVIAVERFDTAAGPLFTGPGFETPRRFAAHPERIGFLDQWAANRALFPRGVDIVFVADGLVAGLPRSARLATTE
ncbi:phosphonate C-P lyase system protein PhnH [Chthonobacter rhizosphaerae]|uniref:phosphonate C-P lyase system protein PhnH n=1 Tax=Chthonobacter rhizosphaerae TaxID=2735553 RepID=UPI0015EF2FE4|nr:phosphonate C-P lyase system protein PhnH [Chthonobacter rhizosphaerae]